MKTIKRVRLLNPSIYHDPSQFHEDGRTKSNGFYSPINDLSAYPVVVEAELCSVLTDYANVSASELDRVMPYRTQYIKNPSHSFSLNWTNNPHTENVPRKSWEEVTPFDFWNKLKGAGREVGDMPGKGYL